MTKIGRRNTLEQDRIRLNRLTSVFFCLFFQWDIIVRRASLVSKYNLPDYGSEPWSSLHDFDELFDRKFGKPAVSEM